MFEKRYLSQLYKSFKSTGGYVISFIGGILSFVAIRYQEEINLNFWSIIFTTISIVIILSFFDSSIHFYKQSLNNSPSVLKVLKRGESTILLTDFSEYFQIQGLVTIFWLNEDYEEFVGYGEIINIQNDKKIQIDLKKINPDINLEEVRKSLIIKPFVTTKTLE
jgi:hypothetical protein